MFFEEKIKTNIFANELIYKYTNKVHLYTL